VLGDLGEDTFLGGEKSGSDNFLGLEGSEESGRGAELSIAEGPGAAKGVSGERVRERRGTRVALPSWEGRRRGEE
jgi:hypothetical protein